MIDLHSLLVRQLRRCGQWPPPPELEALLERVSEAYQDFDEDRRLMNRAMDLASDELTEANADLRRRLAELERTREELVRRQREAEEAQRLATLGQLAAGVGHEINNPLAVVAANLEYLAEAAPPATLSAHQALVEAMESTRRMGAIVRDLRTFARSEGDSKPRAISLAAAATSALQLSHGRVRHHALVRTELETAPKVLADEGRLVQILVNLVLNAAEAGGGLPVDLRLSWDRGPEGQIRVLVQDNGPGIPERIRAHIFEPFFTTKPVGHGTGLGLAICRELAQQMGGRLDLQSTGPSGTCFALSLPRAGPVVVRTTTTEVDPLLQSGLRILVIDDERYVARALQRLLRRHRVHVAGPEEAGEILREADLDLVLCDLMMPGISGDRVYEAASPEARSRFVFMTGGACTETAETFLRETRQPVLVKPFDLDQFEGAARVVLKREQAQSRGS